MEIQRFVSRLNEYARKRKRRKKERRRETKKYGNPVTSVGLLTLNPAVYHEECTWMDCRP